MKLSIEKLYTLDFGDECKDNLIHNQILIYNLGQNLFENPILKMKYSELIKIYLDSEMFKIEMNRIKIREGEEIFNKYQKIVTNFLDYYS